MNRCMEFIWVKSVLFSRLSFDDVYSKLVSLHCRHGCTTDQKGAIRVEHRGMQRWMGLPLSPSLPCVSMPRAEDLLLSTKSDLRMIQ